MFLPQCPAPLFAMTALMLCTWELHSLHSAGGCPCPLSHLVHHTAPIPGSLPGSRRRQSYCLIIWAAPMSWLSWFETHSFKPAGEPHGAGPHAAAALTDGAPGSSYYRTHRSGCTVVPATSIRTGQ
jgi:hypothetical protein